MSGRIKGGGKLEKILTSLEQNSSSAKRVDVGFFRGATYPDGTPVATVAAVQEFGNSRVPARSFMRTTIAEKARLWPKAGEAILRATGCNVRQALETMGGEAASDMQDRIRAITEPALSPATIKKRRAVGSENPTKPLIDTRTMINALSFQVDSDDS